MNSIDILQNEGIYPQNMFDDIQSILVCLSLDGRVLFINRQAEQTFCVSSQKIAGKNFGSIPGNFDLDLIYKGMSQCVMERQPVRLSDITYEYAGKKGILGLTIAPLRSKEGITAGLLLYGTDITARRNLERQVIQSSKMTALGEMATGIAHEMNQPLNIMKIAAQRLEEAVSDGYATQEFTRERAAVIIEQIDRLSGIISHLNVFGRNDDARTVPVDICDPIRNALSLLGEQLKTYFIDVVLDLPKSLPKVAGMATRLEQVFMNLVVNSRDALSSRSGEGNKKIIIKAWHDIPGGLVFVEYADNGPGIPAVIIDRIFDPFFTTKDEGKGTGLGLSISAGIITEHGGSIRAESCDTGARFIIQLPVIRE